MQDGKDTLEVDDVLQPQLPWSIKRLILWIVSFYRISLVVTVLLAHFNYVNGWGLTVHEVGHIAQTYLLPVVILAFLAFLRWQCEKVGLSLRAIWGPIYYPTQFRYIIFAFVSGVIASSLLVGIAVDFDNLPKYSSDMIFFGQMIGSGLLIPFQEELYFRGILYRTLRKRNDVVISNLISAFIFFFFIFGG